MKKFVINIPYGGFHPWHEKNYCDGEYNMDIPAKDIDTNIEQIESSFYAILNKENGVDESNNTYHNITIFVTNNKDGVKKRRPLGTFVIEVKKDENEKVVSIAKWPKKALYEVTYVDEMARIHLPSRTGRPAQTELQRRVSSPQVAAIKINDDIYNTFHYGFDMDDALGMAKVGDYFDGWYYDSEFKNKAVMGEPLTKDVTLYAKWKK